MATHSKLLILLFCKLLTILNSAEVSFNSLPQKDLTANLIPVVAFTEHAIFTTINHRAIATLVFTVRNVNSEMVFAQPRIPRVVDLMGNVWMALAIVWILIQVPSASFLLAKKIALEMVSVFTHPIARQPVSACTEPRATTAPDLAVGNLLIALLTVLATEILLAHNSFPVIANPASLALFVISQLALSVFRANVNLIQSNASAFKDSKVNYATNASAPMTAPIGVSARNKVHVNA